MLSLFPELSAISNAFWDLYEASVRKVVFSLIVDIFSLIVDIENCL
jgi:hypothetical protein